MFGFIIENDLGEQFQIINGKDFVITSISGLNPPSANINTGVVAMSDGEKFNSSRLNYRNIVLTLNILRNVEANRILLYRYFKVKKHHKIYYFNGSREVYIEGYVETFENDLFTQMQQPQISIICPQPYFKDIEDIYFDISQVLAMFEFPFAIEEDGKEFSTLNTTLIGKVINNGDVESGIIIEISASGQIINPKIYDASTNGMLGITITIERGDVIRINTNKGEKKVELIHEGKTTNIINKLMPNPTWFQLDVGENLFTYDCESGNEFFTMRFTHTDLYAGV